MMWSRKIEDKYVISNDSLSKGIHGKIYSATDKNSPTTPLVVKRIISEELFSIMCEVDIMNNYRHLSLMTSKDIFFTSCFCLNGRIQCDIIMERGVPFNTIMEHISLQEIKKYLYQLILGLTFLQSHDLIHGDIKPNNAVIVSRQLKLIDFGYTCRGRLTDPWCGQTYVDRIEMHNRRQRRSLRKCDLETHVQRAMWALGITILKALNMDETFTDRSVILKHKDGTVRRLLLKLLCEPRSRETRFANLLKLDFFASIKSPPLDGFYREVSLPSRRLVVTSNISAAVNGWLKKLVRSVPLSYDRDSAPVVEKAARIFDIYVASYFLNVKGFQTSNKEALFIVFASSCYIVAHQIFDACSPIINKVCSFYRKENRLKFKDEIKVRTDIINSVIFIMSSTACSTRIFERKDHNISSG